MLAALIVLLAYSALTLGEAQLWQNEHSHAWSTAKSWSSATSSTTALPLPVPTGSSPNSTSGGGDYSTGLIHALNAKK
jgi:hypothetical protein